MPDTEHIIIELQRIEEHLNTLARNIDKANSVVPDPEQKTIEKQIHRTADALQRLLRHYNMYGKL